MTHPTTNPTSRCTHNQRSWARTDLEFGNNRVRFNRAMDLEITERERDAYDMVSGWKLKSTLNAQGTQTRTLWKVASNKTVFWPLLALLRLRKRVSKRARKPHNAILLNATPVWAVKRYAKQALNLLIVSGAQLVHGGTFDKIVAVAFSLILWPPV